MHKTILEYYHRNIGLYDLFPLATVIAQAIGAANDKEHQSLLDNHAEKTQDLEGKVIYNIPYEIMGSHRKYLDKKAAYLLSNRILPQSMVVALVSQFDLFVSQSIKYIFNKKPELLAAIQRNITYSEINTLGDIEKIKGYLVEQEIDSVLRSSHFVQIEWFEKKLNTTLKADTDLISDFVEITQRRNLFVHSDGIVSQQYISTCKGHGYDCDKIKAGSKLSVDSEYFTHAADRLIEIGCKLGQIIWRKLIPDERMRANDSLMEITYSLILGCRFRAAANILEFFINNRSKLIHDDTQEYISIINAAQAYKWLKDEKRCAELLNLENWESKSDNFLLSALVLQDRYSDAAKVMRSLGKERHGVDKGAYHDWPVFKEFRKRSEFLDAYRDIYGEEFVERKQKWQPKEKT